MARYMTPNKTAEAMDLPPWMIRTMIKRGEVPGFRQGNRFYVDTIRFAEKLEQDSIASMRTPAEANP